MKDITKEPTEAEIAEAFADIAGEMEYIPTEEDIEAMYISSLVDEMESWR